MMVSGLLTMSKWSCRDCSLGPDIVYDIFSPPLPSSVPPPLFTFLVGRHIIRRHPTGHSLSPRISQEPLEGLLSGRQKNTLHTPFSDRYHHNSQCLRTNASFMVRRTNCYIDTSLNEFDKSINRWVYMRTCLDKMHDKCILRLSLSAPLSRDRSGAALPSTYLLNQIKFSELV